MQEEQKQNLEVGTEFCIHLNYRSLVATFMVAASMPQKGQGSCPQPRCDMRPGREKLLLSLSGLQSKPTSLPGLPLLGPTRLCTQEAADPPQPCASSALPGEAGPAPREGQKGRQQINTEGRKMDVKAQSGFLQKLTMWP